MKLVKCIVLFLFTGFSVEAQKYELGEVTKEELAEKSHPLDPSAGAAILFSKGHSYMTISEKSGFDLVTEVEVKIKIYNKEGYGWANKVIAYYSSSDGEREVVNVDKAATYNLVDGAVKKTKLKSEGEFTENVNKNWKQKKIVMPDIKEGSIIEYKYTIRSPFIQVLPDWRFQESIPVDHSEFVTRIPEYFMFNPNFRGYYTPKVVKSQINRSYNYSSKERIGGRPTEFSNNKVDYTEHVTTYVLDKMPSMKDESYVDNIGNYTASIEHELSVTRFPNQAIKSYSMNWEDVVKRIYENNDFGPELKKTGYFEKDIDALIAGITNPIEKANAIFLYVKKHMNWNDFSGYSCDLGVKKAYADKVGNSADINLMLTAMLRYAGLEANPVLVSTRANKVALFPARSAFNYVIAAIEIDNKVILFDATSKSALPNILPIRVLNWTGRLIKKDGTSLSVDLAPTIVSREMISLSVNMDKDGKISGKARDQYYDYNAFRFRENYSGTNKDSYVEMLEKHYKGLQVNEYKVTNDDPFKPVIEEYDFIHDGLTDIIGDKIYINPMLHLVQTESPFKQEKREYPIDFIFPQQDKYMININIPEGYAIESVPASANLKMEENLGGFKYLIAQQNNQIQIVVTFEINQANVSPIYYATLKDFYQKMVEKQSEKIVLKKV
ncbi:DUF3857 domain-containing protein [Flavobacterium cerinum]|uniref:DUF3857 domain-containing protein n=1 Tax=Flavobacterium cerinum TaxID=2502784 RepID=A0A3S3QU98_9FLAO|nr:DUF3857 domain-containing protein [Flavobacterium cerinum]RWX03720.1 DUF3857 domain-containing protein [Flavobacterium cerinum]